MKSTLPFLAALAFTLLFSCKNEMAEVANPPAPGFDLEGSDPAAIAIADEVMAAMGGRKAWDNARYLSWVFFDFRKLTWDKKTGDVRIESYPDSSVYLLNVNTLAGKFKTKGVEVTNPDSLKMHLERGKSIWINDSYWLVMPFKLKDSGVTLKHLSQGQTKDGKPADILSLTFKEVGDTPQNKYHVFVDKATRLVTQWDFFRYAEQDTADFSNPWADYQKFGPLLLSGNRGKGKMGEISVDGEISPAVFTTF